MGLTRGQDCYAVLLQHQESVCLVTQLFLMVWCRYFQSCFCRVLTARCTNFFDCMHRPFDEHPVEMENGWENWAIEGPTRGVELEGPTRGVEREETPVPERPPLNSGFWKARCGS